MRSFTRRSLTTTMAVLIVLALGATLAYALSSGGGQPRQAAADQYSTQTTSPSTPSTPGAVTGQGTTPTSAVSPPGSKGNNTGSGNQGTNGSTGTGNASASGAGGNGAGAGGNGAGATNAALPSNVALVFLSKRDNRVLRNVRRSVRDLLTGQLRYDAVLNEPLDIGALREAAQGTQFADLSAATLPDLAQQLGEDIFDPTDLFKAEVKVDPVKHTGLPLFSKFRGQLTPLTGIVLAHDALPKLKGDDAKNRTAFYKAFFAGLKSTKLPIVGVETRKVSKKKSTIPFFEKYGISTVDNVDSPSGRVSVARLLTGATQGNYGTKPGVDGLMPDAASIKVG